MTAQDVHALIRAAYHKHSVRDLGALISFRNGSDADLYVPLGQTWRPGNGQMVPDGTYMTLYFNQDGAVDGMWENGKFYHRHGYITDLALSTL